MTDFKITAPAVEASDLERAARIAELTTREVAELPDRTSPPDEPLLMLVTEHELAQIIEPLMSAEFAAIRREAAASPSEFEWEAIAALREAETVIGFDLFDKIHFGPSYNQAVRDMYEKVVTTLAKATERGL